MSQINSIFFSKISGAEIRFGARIGLRTGLVDMDSERSERFEWDEVLAMGSERSERFEWDEVLAMGSERSERFEWDEVLAMGSFDWKDKSNGVDKGISIGTSGACCNTGLNVCWERSALAEPPTGGGRVGYTWRNGFSGRSFVLFLFPKDLSKGEC